MPNDVESELKRVRSKSKGKRAEQPRDRSMTVGERGESRSEKRRRAEEKRKPKQASIIQRPPG